MFETFAQRRQSRPNKLSNPCELRSGARTSVLQWCGSQAHVLHGRSLLALQSIRVNRGLGDDAMKIRRLEADVPACASRNLRRSQIEKKAWRAYRAGAGALRRSAAKKLKNKVY